ncbi:hypothetical protein GJV44_00875 [Candidatus Vallotia cooleyia]|nr:hypothetical protein GJV44_00875 [Candidatus Vallotia cooleyia]
MQLYLLFPPTSVDHVGLVIRNMRFACFFQDLSGDVLVHYNAGCVLLFYFDITCIALSAYSGRY